MALKKSTRRAVKPPARTAPKSSAPDMDPSYDGNYGDATKPLYQRSVGMQPNSRARSAVERAEERLAALSPRARAKAKPKQMPGMDISYNADREIDQFHRRSPSVAAEPDPDSLGDGEEVIETEAQREQRKTLERMPPVGRSEDQRVGSRIPTRNQYGRIQALNRAGKIISRTHYAAQDKFDVPLHMIPDGWTYQWLSQATVGMANNNAHFFANGWEPVPSKRHDGIFMQKGHDGPIIVDGMLLVERPVELTLEARAEELRAAKILLRTQNEQFQPRLPGAREARYRGTELRVKRDLEEMPDDLRPQLIVDDGREDLR